jgi:hypothetical protein
MRRGRFTRSTNAFSKKIENHAAAVALYFMYYNFGRVHQTLRVTPAMEAGVSDHVWSIEEVVGPLRLGTGANMEQITVAGFVLVVLAAKGLAILALAYVGARLAIRHERHASSN